MTPEFLKAMQDLDDEALHSLRNGVARTGKATDVFLARVAMLMGEQANDGNDSTDTSDADKQEPVAIDGVGVQGSPGNGAP